jgi:pimeloyl-ACP methyl ester carboxylesterase
MMRIIYSLCLLSILFLLTGCGAGRRDDGAARSAGVVKSFDGVPIAFSMAGEGTPVLLLIHGWMCDRTYWSAQVEAFSSNYTVVAIDLGGHGGSGLGRGQWTLTALGEDVKAVAEHLDLKQVVVIGHSMGGPVGLEAARLMPHRIIGVIGVDTFHDADLEYDPKEWKALLDALEEDFQGTCDEFVRAMFHESADPALVEKTSEDMCSGPADVGKALMAWFEHYDLRAALRAVSIPIRAVNADMWPTNVDVNRKYAPGFDVEELKDMGHFPMLERPRIFRKALEKTIQDVLAGRK